MFGKRLVLLVLIVCSGFSGVAQKILYSEPEKDDTRRLDFEVITKRGESGTRIACRLRLDTSSLEGSAIAEVCLRKSCCHVVCPDPPVLRVCPYVRVTTALL